MISPDEQARLAVAIRDAEATTAGEIVVVIAGQASGYRSVPLLWALIAALIVPWPLIELTNLATSRIFLVQIAVALVLSVVLSLPRRRYALVPGFIKRGRARDAAAREFVTRGLAGTRHRTGVLIYVAAAEHYAEILADTGITARVDQSEWDTLIARLVNAIKDGRAGEGLVSAVAAAGTILARHAPPLADDSDELPNRVIVI